MGRKVSFVVVFTDITRRRVLSEKASIYTPEMTIIKFHKIQKRRQKMDNMYRLSELYAVY